MLTDDKRLWSVMDCNTLRNENRKRRAREDDEGVDNQSNTRPRRFLRWDEDTYTHPDLNEMYNRFLSLPDRHSPHFYFDKLEKALNERANYKYQFLIEELIDYYQKECTLYETVGDLRSLISGLAVNGVRFNYFEIEENPMCGFSSVKADEMLEVLDDTMEMCMELKRSLKHVLMSQTIIRNRDAAAKVVTIDP
jgi:hypothetical protein